LTGLGWLVELGGGAVAPFGRALMSAAVHAGLLAIGCAVVFEGLPAWRASATRLGAVVILASLMGRTTAWGAVALLAVPVALVAEFCRGPEAAAVGLTWPKPRAIALGLAAGVFLGGHLLITSSHTFGYVIELDDWRHYLGAVAYDVGVSAVSAEWLFRGAL